MRDLADSLYGAPPAPPSQPASATSAPPPAPPVSPSPVPAPVGAAPSPVSPPATASPSEAPSGEAAQAAPSLTADAIAAGVPAEIRQQRADAARKLYGGDAELAKVMPDEMFKEAGVAPDVQAALAAEVRAIAGDLGLVPADVGGIRTALAAERANPASDERRVANREQIIDAMNRQYGQGAKQAWLDARNFLAQDPRRAAFLAPVGDDPKTALRIVELAQRAKKAGRLR